MKPYLLWLLFFISSVSFLLFQKWYWAFLDTSFIPFIQYYNPLTLISSLSNVLSNNVSILGESTSFWFDFSERMSTAFMSYFLLVTSISLFWANVWYIFFLWISSLLIFFFARKCIKYLSFEYTYSYLVALIVTFNPVTFWLYNESIILLAYAGIFMTTYFILKIYHKIQPLSLLWLIIGIYFLMSYPRVFLIYVFGVFFWLLFWWYKYVIVFLKNHYKKDIFLMIFSTFFAFLPFIYILFFKYFDKTNSFDNYIQLWITQFWDEFYWRMRSLWFLNNIPLINYFPSGINQSLPYKIFFLLFIYWWIIFFYLQKMEKSKFISLALLVVIFLKTSASFVGLELFKILNYQVFPFQANTLSWIDVIFIVLIAYIWYKILVKNANLQVLVYIALFLWTVDVCFGWKILHTPYLSKIQIPSEYELLMKDTSSYSNISMVSYPPQNQLIFPGYQYPLWYNNISRFNTLLSTNSRFVSLDQVELAKYIEQNWYKIPSILKSMGLSHILISNNSILNPDFGILYYTPPKEYWAYWSWIESFVADGYMKNTMSWIDVYSNNTTNHSLYIADRVNSIDDSLFQNIALYNRKESDLDNLYLLNNSLSGNINNSVFVSSSWIWETQLTKWSLDVLYNPIKPYYYFLKIIPDQKNIPLLIQLNKTYSHWWKMHIISKIQYQNMLEMSQKKEYFSETRNSFSFLDTAFISPFLEKWSLINHMKGNFVGNAWMIKPDDIPSQMKQESEIYAVIIYEKQIYYTIALIVSGFTFLMLFLLSLLDVYRKFQKPKNNNL